MSKYRVQNYSKTLTIPAGSGSVLDTLPSTGAGLNGIVRCIGVLPPATLTGSSYTISILGNKGENLYSLASNSAGSNVAIIKDANNNSLAIPVAFPPGANWLAISVPSDTAAQGTLTSGNTDNSNGETVTIGTTVYTFKTALTEAYATGTITDGNASNVSDGDTITVNGRVYRFKNTIAQINDVHIGASADASLTNFVSAINGAGTVGTDYYTGTTANADVTAGTVTSHATVLTAKSLGTAGNNITLSKSASTLTLSGLSSGKLSGGVDSVANEVLIAGTADGSLTNLQKAINGSSGAGTNYSTVTVANTQVTCGNVTSHAVTVTADVENATGNTIATTTTAAHLSWGHATLTGSGEAADRTFPSDVYIDR